ncbi:hypothetical protein TNCV_4348751 [Trichonephila clavipes]|nr:hypothetical protein TNCV_4348751 [Trichonephila clavipes]
MLNHSNKSDSRTERRVAFNDFPIFDDLLQHSIDVFSISAHCLNTVAQRYSPCRPPGLEIGITQECGCVGFNRPDGRQGCVLTRTVESNQGGRFDSNESVADSFPSGAVGFKSWSATILEAFFPLTSARKTSSREANSLPEVTPQSLLS